MRRKVFPERGNEASQTIMPSSFQYAAVEAGGGEEKQYRRADLDPALFLEDGGGERNESQKDLDNGVANKIRGIACDVAHQQALHRSDDHEDRECDLILAALPCVK